MTAPAANFGLMLEIIMLWMAIRCTHCTIGWGGILAGSSTEHEHNKAQRRLSVAWDVYHNRTSFLCPERERKLGWTYHGDLSRFRQALDRHRQGHNLTVAAIGGSITAGAGAWEAHAWPEWLEDWLRERFPARLQFKNGAVPGTMSSYMSMCHKIHVPREADVIIVEYALNDVITTPTPLFDNPIRRAYERLLRKLLNYPNRPAIIMLNAFAYAMPPTYPGLFYSSAEREFYEFATYYQLPFISVKSAVYELMEKGAHGFNVTTYRADENLNIKWNVDHLIRDDVFYSDDLHPNGWTGHLVMAELVEQVAPNHVQVFMDVQAALAAQPLSVADVQAASRRLPPPLVKGNYESISDKCFIGELLQQSVLSAEGFSWNNDAPAGKKPKFGFISLVPGSKLRIHVNTTAGLSGPDVLVSMQLALLKSYHRMGMAQVSCEQGCRCNSSIFDGHQQAKNSLLNLHAFLVSQAHKCIISVQVMQSSNSDLIVALPLLPQTSNSGGHKVKVAGIMVSEEGGAGKQGFGDSAINFVH